MNIDPWGQEIEEGSSGYHGIFAITRPLDADQPKPFGEQNRFLVARVGAKDYLLNIDLIQEIIIPPKITYVPNSPKYIQGVINLRGTILPVINLKKMLGEERSAPSVNTRILVCEEKSSSIKTGVFVDGISVVVGVPSADIDPSTTPLAQSGLDLMEAVSKYGKDFLGIISLAKVLIVAGDGRAFSESPEDMNENQNSA